MIAASCKWHTRVTVGAIPAIAGTVGALVVEKRKNFLFYEKVRRGGVLV